MKKLFSFLLVVVLSFSLSVSAFAVDKHDYNGVSLPFYPDNLDLDAYPYVIVVPGLYGSYNLMASTQPWVVDGSSNFSYGSANFDLLQWEATIYVDSWTFNGEYKNQDSTGGRRSMIWANHNIYRRDNGALFLNASPNPHEVYVECDGTACPANDHDFDNICDDCGNVLAFSLRSTLLDYAKNLAETDSSFSQTHKYYAVVEHPTEPEKYVVYVSEILMGSTDSEIVTGGNMKRTVVLTMESGAFANQGWSSVDSWSGNVVYANHTIPFFFRVPLVVTVQGPTGEQMEMGTLNLT